MTDDHAYKHIKVAPAEEPDVIIHAGIREEAPSSAESAAKAAGQRPETEAPSPEAAAEEPPSTVSSASADGVPGRSAKGAYQPTTLDDIEGSKMPKTQVVVIIACVLAIIAFAIWYVFFS